MLPIVIVSLQDRPYNFEEVPALHENLTRFHFLDTDVLYDVSLQREPRCVCVCVCVCAMLILS